VRDRIETKLNRIEGVTASVNYVDLAGGITSATDSLRLRGFTASPRRANPTGEVRA
jgi:hypothetical protein